MGTVFAGLARRRLFGHCHHHQSEHPSCFDVSSRTPQTDPGDGGVCVGVWQLTAADVGLLRALAAGGGDDLRGDVGERAQLRPMSEDIEK